jgi:GT2 family glycosyltransferase/peptidoglycan/xylan/chitin deacetylase (PgdA/CDA1 family)
VPPLELSVIIPSHSRKAVLRRCLEALARQTQPPETFEVIVVDDASTDGTAEMVQNMETPYTLRVLSLNPNRGEWGASNAGIEAASGRLCVLLDDDVVPEPGMLAAHVAAHQREPHTAAIGRLIQQPPPDSDWYTLAYASAWNEGFAQLERREAKWTDCYSGNLSVEREGLLEIGGFNEDPTADGDSELAYRLHKARYWTRYVPDAVGTHCDQKRRDRLLRDRARNGAAAVRWWRRDPAMMPELLGWFGASNRRENVQRRLMLALRVPPELLARLGPCMPGQARREYAFHFTSRYAFWKSVREQVSRTEWNSLTQGVPVLMYHAFSDSDEEDRYIVSRRAFSRQLRLLKALRYEILTFEELCRGLREHRLPPPRAAVITMDDGYEDNLKIAEPVLRRHKVRATLYLVSNRIGQANDWSRKPPMLGRPLLSQNQLEQLRGGPIALGAHTRNHPRLADVPDEQVPEEIEGSRRELAERLGEPMTTFAYPFGIYDERAVATVEASDLVGACTTEPRLSRPIDSPALIPRIEVQGWDTLPRFLIKLLFGVDQPAPEPATPAAAKRGA